MNKNLNLNFKKRTMFGAGGYGGQGGFSGAEHSKMMFADMDEDDFDEEDYGTDDYDDEGEEDISATDSELIAMEQYRR